MSRPDNHGMSAREKNIIDLWEAGRGSIAIAAEMRLAESYVVRIIQAFSTADTKEDIKYFANIREASEQLAARICEVRARALT